MSLDHIQKQWVKPTPERAPQASELSSELVTKFSKKGPTPAIVQAEENQQSLVQQLINQKNTDQTRQQITKRSIEQAQERGIIQNEELEEEINRTLEKQLSKSLNVDDQVELSETYSKKNPQKDGKTPPDPMAQFMASKKANKKKQLGLQKKETFDDIKDTPDEPETDTVFVKANKKESKKNVEQQIKINVTINDVKDYAKLLSKYATSKDPNTKQLMERKKQVLLQKGVSTSQINHMSLKVGQVIKQHMVYDLKQKLIRFHMSKGGSKQDQVESKLQFNAAANHAEAQQQGPNIPMDLTHTLDQLRHQAKQDLGNFLYEESIHQFTKFSLKQISIETFTEELLKLSKAAESAGFQLSEKDLTEKIIAAVDHLGLAEFKKPDTQSNQQQKQQTTPHQTQEEVLDDKLRYLYMMKALHPSLRKQVSTFFKIKKTKNGLIKLGFYTEEKHEELKRQGEFLAVTQFKEELRFIFREEATLAHLTGAEYGVLRKKQAFVITQIRKTSFSISTREINSIRETAYIDMYSLMKEELLQLQEMAEIHQHVSITRKIKHLSLVIGRIKDSFNIHDFKDSVQKLINVKETLINEHA